MLSRQENYTPFMGMKVFVDIKWSGRTQVGVLVKETNYSMDKWMKDKIRGFVQNGVKYRDLSLLSFEGRRGSGQANILIYKHYHPQNSHFQGLEAPFRGQNGHRKELSPL